MSRYKVSKNKPKKYESSKPTQSAPVVENTIIIDEVEANGNGQIHLAQIEKEKNFDEIIIENTSIEPLKEESKGIVILALGHPQYGRMAANLASSIRGNCDLPIHLVYSGDAIAHLLPQHLALFASKSECPSEYYTSNGKTAYFKAKTKLFDLSPFERTIYLDADTIMFSGKSISELFDAFKDVDITFENYGKLRPNHLWFDAKEAIMKFGDRIKHDIYEVRSQLIYFRKTESNKLFFDTATEIYDNPKVKSYDFRGNVPDELAFNIASGIIGIKPHQENYKVIHWEMTDGKNKRIVELLENYYGISVGGEHISPNVKTQYDGIARFFQQKLQLPYFYKLYPKKQWLKK